MYKIICDRCGEAYGQYSEMYELERQLYRIHRYVDGIDEYGDRKLRTICLCPKCEGELDVWLGLGIPKDTAYSMLRDEDFGLPKRIDNND